MTPRARPAPTAPNCIICDIYLRLSDLRLSDLDDGGTSKGLAFSERRLTDFVDRLGYTLGEVIVENDMRGDKPKSASAFTRKRVIRPDGTPDTRPDGSPIFRVHRPEFQRLLTRLRRGQSHAVAVVDIDRLVRDPRDIEDVIEVVHQLRLNVRSISGSITLTDGGTDTEVFNARLQTSLAHKSVSDTARRVRDARLRQALNGEYGGGRRPYGFEADGVTVIPAEAAVIVNAAEDMLAGVPLRSIVADLRQRHVPTVQGIEWSSMALRTILLRPRNAGFMVNNGKIVGAAPWDLILPEETWRIVVDALTDPDRRTTPGPAPKHLGSGIFLCVCGLNVRPSTKRRGPVYRCSSLAQLPRPPKDSASQHVARDMGRVDDVVRDWIIERLGRADAASLIEDTPDAPDGAIDPQAARERRKTLRAKLINLAEMHVDDEIDDAQLAAATRRINAELATLNEQLAPQVTRSPLAALIAADDIGAAWDALSLGGRRLVVQMLATVTILPAGRGVQFHPSQVRIEPRA